MALLLANADPPSFTSVLAHDISAYRYRSSHVAKTQSYLGEFYRHAHKPLKNAAEE